MKGVYVITRKQVIMYETVRIPAKSQTEAIEIYKKDHEQKVKEVSRGKDLLSIRRIGV